VQRVVGTQHQSRTFSAAAPRRDVINSAGHAEHWLQARHLSRQSVQPLVRHVQTLDELRLVTASSSDVAGNWSRIAAPPPANLPSIRRSTTLMELFHRAMGPSMFCCDASRGRESSSPGSP
jgi:hypothetical protein